VYIAEMTGTVNYFNDFVLQPHTNKILAQLLVWNLNQDVILSKFALTYIVLKLQHHHSVQPLGEQARPPSAHSEPYDDVLLP